MRAVVADRRVGDRRRAGRAPPRRSSSCSVISLPRLCTLVAASRVRARSPVAQKHRVRDGQRPARSETRRLFRRRSFASIARGSKRRRRDALLDGLAGADTAARTPRRPRSTCCGGVLVVLRAARGAAASALRRLRSLGAVFGRCAARWSPSAPPAAPWPPPARPARRRGARRRGDHVNSEGTSVTGGVSCTTYEPRPRHRVAGEHAVVVRNRGERRTADVAGAARACARRTGAQPRSPSSRGPRARASPARLRRARASARQMPDGLVVSRIRRQVMPSFATDGPSRRETMSAITALKLGARRPPPSPELWVCRAAGRSPSRGDANKPAGLPAAGLPARPMFPSGKGGINAARTRATRPPRAPTRAARRVWRRSSTRAETSPTPRTGQRVDARACDPRCGAASDAGVGFSNDSLQTFSETTYMTYGG